MAHSSHTILILNWKLPTDCDEVAKRGHGYQGRGIFPRSACDQSRFAYLERWKDLGSAWMARMVVHDE